MLNMRYSIGALLLCFVVSSWSANKNIERPKQGNQQAYTEQRGTQNAPLFLDGEVTTKKDKEEARQDAEERKFKAVLDSELVTYTRYLAIGTFLLFFFTAVLCLITWLLSRDAKELGTAQANKMELSIDEATRAATAMEDVAKATTNNADRFQDMMRKQFRAYISVECAGSCYQDASVAFQMDMAFRNDGLTPARKVAYSLRVAVLPLPLSVNFDFGVEEPPPYDATMAPRQVFTASKYIERLPDVESEQAFDKGTHSLYAWGTVHYEDIFGGKQSTNFCHSVHFIRFTDEGGKAQIRLRHSYNRIHNDST